MVHGRTHILAWLILATAIATTVAIPANAQQEPSTSEYEKIFQISQPKSTIKIVEKFSKIIEGPNRITQVDGFDPEVISVSPLSPTRLRVQALTPGVTTMTLLDENNKISSVEVFVTGDVRHLQAYIQQLFPQSSVEAIEVQDSIVLRGWVTQPEHITEINEVAEQFYPRVLNQMKVGGVQQVMLKVKVMEVQRSMMRNFGFNFTNIDGNQFFASAPGGGLSPAMGMMGGGLTGITVTPTTPTIAFGVISPGSTFAGFLEALKSEGLAKIEAEPILVTTNGRPAKLLNGGEFPILVPQSLGSTSVDYKEFGVAMEAVPIILGNGRLRLELAPEVSQLDPTNGVTIAGANIPALSTRRVNTQVEMKFGQTLMIAGLINKRTQQNTFKVPILGEIPWLGMAFSRKTSNEIETELVMLVTPEFVSPLSSEEGMPILPGQHTAPPTDRELFIDGLLEVPNYGEPVHVAPPVLHSPYDIQGNGAIMQEEPLLTPVPEGEGNSPAPPPAPGSDTLETTPVLPPPSTVIDPVKWERKAAPLPAQQTTLPQQTRTGRGWAPRFTDGLLKP